MIRWQLRHADFARPQLIALLAVSLIAGQVRVLAEVKETPDGKQWKVKCARGACPGANLKLTVGPQKITVTKRGLIKDKDRVAFTIPVGEVESLAYSVVTHGSGEGWDNFWYGFEPGSTGEPGDLLAGLVLIGVLAGVSTILEQVQQTDHQVILIWRDVDGENSMVVIAPEDDCKSLLTELHRVTGRDLRDLPGEIREVAQEFQQDRDKFRMARVDLDRSARLPGRGLALPPGPYQLVLLEREPNLGELYFYSRPDTKPEYFVGRSVVTIDDRAPDTATTPVTYTEEGGRVTISEVQFEEKALKLFAAPPTPKAPAGRPVAPADTRPEPAEILRTCRTLAVSSKTVWFKAGRLYETLKKTSDFSQTGLSLIDDENQADVVVQVNRPLFTFDWTYVISHRESGAKLGEGKVTAWDDKAAAPKLARDILAQLSSHPPAAEAPFQTLPKPPPQAEEPWAVP